MTHPAIARNYVLHSLTLLGQDALAEILQKLSVDVGQLGFQIEPRLTVKADSLLLGLNVRGAVVDKYSGEDLPLAPGTDVQLWEVKEPEGNATSTVAPETVDPPWDGNGLEASAEAVAVEATL